MIGEYKNSVEKEISAGLLRQRRNLLLISLIMPLFFLSGASINQINMFGTVINIQNQSGIYIVLFVIYFYFLWRYLQYYLEENRAKEFSSLRKDKIAKIEFDYLKGLMFKKTDCFEIEHYYPSYKPEALDKKMGIFRKSRAMQIYGLPNKYYHHYSRDSKSPKKLPADEIQLIEKEWKYVEKQQGDSRSDPIFETDVAFNWLYLKWLKFKGNLIFYIVHPYFSDYKLPFIIAAVSLIVSVVYAK